MCYVGCFAKNVDFDEILHIKIFFFILVEVFYILMDNLYVHTMYILMKNLCEHIVGRKRFQ